MASIDTNKLLVSKLQDGNPLLKQVKDVSYVFADIKPDYVTGPTSCVLFLSMQYHRLHPDYIYRRIAKLGKDFDLRTLLVVVDIENPSDTLQELIKAALVHDMALLVATSFEEAAGYISQLKLRASNPLKPPSRLARNTYPSQLEDVVTKVQGVNKTNAVSLAGKYGSFREMLRQADTVEQLQGWGPKKGLRFQEAVTEPFKVSNLFSRQEARTQSAGPTENQTAQTTPTTGRQTPEPQTETQTLKTTLN